MGNSIFPTLQSPNWKLTRTPVWNSVVRTAATLNRTRAPLHTKPLWRWTLKNAVLESAATIADLQTIQDFYNARAGQFDSFLWRDPEPGSLADDPDAQASVLGVYYWPVAFTVDSVDFERFAYQLWQCGTISFTQIALGPAELWGLSNHGSITSATLHITTAHTEVGVTAPGNEVAVCSANGHISLSTFLLDLNAPNGDTWTKTTNNIDLTTVSSGLQYVPGFTLDFFIAEGVGSPGVGNVIELLVYSCSIDLSYADGTAVTLVPTGASVLYDGISPSNTTDYVANAANAADSDPNSYATIHRENVLPTGSSSTAYPVLTVRFP